MAEKIDRVTGLERAAKTRALVIAYLNNVGAPVKYADLRNDLSSSLDAIGANQTSLSNVLNRLANNQQITRVKTHGKLVLYSCASSKTDRSNHAAEPRTQKVQPDVQITMVKKTGAMRIRHGKMIVEISFVDE